METDPHDEGSTRLSYELAWVALAHQGYDCVQAHMEWPNYPDKYVTWGLAQLFEERENKNN